MSRVRIIGVLYCKASSVMFPTIFYSRTFGWIISFPYTCLISFLLFMILARFISWISNCRQESSDEKEQEEIVHCHIAVHIGLFQINGRIYSINRVLDFYYSKSNIRDAFRLFYYFKLYFYLYKIRSTNSSILFKIKLYYMLRMFDTWLRCVYC